MPEAPTQQPSEEVRAVTQQEILDRVISYGRKIPNVLFWGAAAYTVMIPGGLILGGLVAGGAAAYFGAGAILTTGAAALGVAAGGVGGFFGAKFVFKEMVGDMALSLGLDAGEMTLRSLRRLLKQARDNRGGAEKAPKTAKLALAAEAAHRFSVRLRDLFGEKAEPPGPEEQKPEPAPAVAQARQDGPKAVA